MFLVPRVSAGTLVSAYLSIRCPLSDVQFISVLERAVRRATGEYGDTQ